MPSIGSTLQQDALEKRAFYARQYNGFWPAFNRAFFQSLLTFWFWAFMTFALMKVCR